MPYKNKEAQNIEDFGNKLVNLKKPINKLNFFKVVDIDEQELVHSAFIAWLLDPKESHNLGNAFLGLFLKNLCNYQLTKSVAAKGAKPNQDILKNLLKEIDVVKQGVSVVDYVTGLASDDNLSVKTEVSFKRASDAAKKDRLDILIIFENSKTVLVIENKFNSKLAKDQLLRYEKTLETYYADYDKIYVYLRKDDSIPEDNIVDGKGTYNSNWCIIDYNTIYNIVGEVYVIAKNTNGLVGKKKIMNFMEDYMSLINPMNCKEVGKACRAILKVNANVEAINMLNEYCINERAVLNYIFNFLRNNQDLKDLGAAMPPEDPFDNSKQLDFRTEKLRKFLDAHNHKSEKYITYHCGTDGRGIGVWLFADKNDANKAKLTKTQQDLTIALGKTNNEIEIIVPPEKWGLPLDQIIAELDENLNECVKEIIEIDKKIP